MTALPCIVCGKTLEAVAEDNPKQPYGGVGFTSPGHYGSTVFDQEGFFDTGAFLALNVCDSCLTTAGERGHVLHGQRERIHPKTTYTNWPTT